MKRFLLISSLFLSTPAWADLAPLRLSDQMIQSKIAAYNDPESSAETLWNSVKAISQSARRGQALAQAFLVKESLGIDPALDEKNGLILKFKARCAQKDIGSCSRLYQIYRQGLFGLTDPARALSYAEQAIALKSSPVAFDLATDYSYGRGVEKDLVKAHLLFEKAAELGNEKGALQAANDYFDGIGVEKDLVKARVFHKRAASLAAGYYNRYVEDGIPHDLKQKLKALEEKLDQAEALPENAPANPGAPATPPQTNSEAK